MTKIARASLFLFAASSLLGCEATDEVPDETVAWLTEYSVKGVEEGIDYNEDPSLNMGRLKLREDVDDVSPAQRLSKLAYLSLSGTGLTDVAPLGGLESLLLVNVADTPIEAVDALDRPRPVPLVVLYRKSTTRLRFGADDPSGHLQFIDLDSPCEEARQSAFEQGAMPFERLQSTRAFNEVPVLLDDANPERGVIAFMSCSAFLEADL